MRHFDRSRGEVELQIQGGELYFRANPIKKTEEYSFIVKLLYAGCVYISRGGIR